MSQSVTIGPIDIEINYESSKLDQLEAQLKRIAEQVDHINGQHHYPGIDLAIKIKEESGRAGSEAQESTKKLRFLQYWKIEAFIEGQDFAIVGYTKNSDPLRSDGDFITLFQNPTGIDSINIPLSRVIAIKSYAVAK